MNQYGVRLMVNRRVGFLGLGFLFLVLCYFVIMLPRTRHLLPPIVEQNSKLSVRSDLQNETEKYLIYMCGSYMCGGWANRLYGIVNTYFFACMSGRKFRIKVTKPCDISLFLEPNKIHWKFEKSELENLKSETLNRIDSLELKRSIPTVDFNKLFKSDVTYLAIDWDYTLELRQRHDIHKISGYNSMTIAGIYRQIISDMFRYKTDIKKDLDRFLAQRRQRKLVCAHIRIEDQYSEYHGNKDIIWNWFKLHNNSKYVLYLATNRQNFKNSAKDMFGSRLIDAPGTITHIDKSHECSGFKKALLDHAILSSCDILLLSPSGFGITAAFVRGKSEALYCLLRDVIFPCPVGTLHEIFVKHIGPIPHV